MAQKQKAVVLFSGGVDSTTCLALAIERFGKDNVVPLSIQYGQKHSKELEAAASILAYYGIEGKTMDVTKLFAFSNCSLLTQSTEAIPQGSYKEQQETEGEGTVSTYVPFRNGLFLSAAASLALSLDCGYIYYGAHSDDAAGNAYPDCTEHFYKSMGDAIFEGSGKECSLEAPFINHNKADVEKKDYDSAYHTTSHGPATKAATNHADTAAPVSTDKLPLKQMALKTLLYNNRIYNTYKLA